VGCTIDTPTREASTNMKHYVIERDMPGAGELTVRHLTSVRAAFNWAASSIGPGVQWMQSFVTADRIYCHYMAESEEVVREHAKRAGLPATKVSEVRSLVDPMAVSHRNG
jgi:hypothetical protein